MEIKVTNYFSFAVKDEPGELARITAALMEAEVDLEGLWGFGTGSGKAQVIVIPRDRLRFRQAAAKGAWDFREGTCFRLTGEDRIGALVDTLNRVASSKINLHAVDAMGMDGQFGCYLWAEEDQGENLRRLLTS